MPAVTKCNLCDKPDEYGPRSESAVVRSNIREFRNEMFTVWRCGGCRSLHARNIPDLAPYYAAYPFHQQKLDWSTRRVYANLTRRLIRARLDRSSAILDHGCGSGLLVGYLRSRGFTNTVGYDSYSSRFNDPAVLDRRYDCIVSQDVVEHVDDPRALLRQYDGWARPGAIIAVGTPNAEAIHLHDPERHVHSLHQPYHTHMFSRRALIAAGEALGWTLQRFYPMSYVNTRIPCINIPYGLYYARCFDDTLNLAFERLRAHPRLFSPRAIWLALFGYYACPDADVMAVFRKPAARQQ